MNIPNRLTIVRMVLTPIFFLVSLLDFNGHSLFALLIFIAACLTDFIDGRYARRYNQITVFGKLMDPVADKMVTTAALLVFVCNGWCSFLVPVIILSRDYLINAIRLVASRQSVVIPANIWGKLKTIFQMVFSGLILFGAFLRDNGIAFQPFSTATNGSLQEAILSLELFAQILMWTVAFLTIASGLTYFLQSRKLLATPESRQMLIALVYEEILYPILSCGTLLYFMSAGLCNSWVMLLFAIAGFGVSSFQLVAAVQEVNLPLKHWNNSRLLLMGLLTLLLLAKMGQDIFGLFKGTQFLPVAGQVLTVGGVALCIAAGVLCMLQSKKRIDFSK